MGFNKSKQNSQLSKTNVEKRILQRNTLAFCFAKMTKCEKYNFKYVENSKLECYKAVFQKIQQLCEMTFDNFLNSNNKDTKEYIPVKQFDKSFINSVDSGIDKIVVTRISQRGRIYWIVDNDRIAYLLGIDYLGQAYSH